SGHVADALADHVAGRIDRLREHSQIGGELTVLVVDVTAHLSGIRTLLGGRPVDLEVMLPARHQGVVPRGAGRRCRAGAGARRSQCDDQTDQEPEPNRFHGPLPLPAAYHSWELGTRPLRYSPHEASGFRLMVPLFAGHRVDLTMTTSEAR